MYMEAAIEFHELKIVVLHVAKSIRLCKFGMVCFDFVGPSITVKTLISVGFVCLCCPCWVGVVGVSP